MRKSARQDASSSEHGAGIGWQSADRRSWWPQHREASLNWLALGLLLAAWNASDNDLESHAKRRPESLRGYSYVSVRAQRSAAINQ